jgi:hypothetical protein
MQVPYPFVINGVKVCTYKADFVEKLKTGEWQIVDVKGFKTSEYKLKKKLLKAVYGLDITEM